MKIGYLSKDLKGKISTLETTFYLKLQENNQKQSEKSPTHNVMAQNHSGDVFQIGSAWERKITAGDRAGSSLYSITLDDPAFKTSLNCTAFPTDTGDFKIDWERQEAKTSSEF